MSQSRHTVKDLFTVNVKYENCSHLDEDSEEDDGDDGGEEQILHLVVSQQESQREGDGAS